MASISRVWCSNNVSTWAITYSARWPGSSALAGHDAQQYLGTDLQHAEDGLIASCFMQEQQWPCISNHGCLPLLPDTQKHQEQGSSSTTSSWNLSTAWPNSDASSDAYVINKLDCCSYKWACAQQQWLDNLGCGHKQQQWWATERLCSVLTSVSGRPLVSSGNGVAPSQQPAVHRHVTIQALVSELMPPGCTALG